MVTEKAVGKHINDIFSKLGVPMAADDNRRVLSVLRYLQDQSRPVRSVDGDGRGHYRPRPSVRPRRRS